VLSNCGNSCSCFEFAPTLSPCSRAFLRLGKKPASPALDQRRSSAMKPTEIKRVFARLLNPGSGLQSSASFRLPVGSDARSTSPRLVGFDTRPRRRMSENTSEDRAVGLVCTRQIAHAHQEFADDLPAGEAERSAK